MTENNFGHNYSAATNLPVLIVVTTCIIGILAWDALFWLLIYHKFIIYVVRERGRLVRIGVLSVETADKLISGVSGYVNKPTVYEVDVIMEAT